VEVFLELYDLNQSKLFIHVYSILFCLTPIYIIFRQREQYVKHYLPWAIQTGLNSNFMLNIYFEKRWEQPMEELHKELNIKPLEIINLK